MLALLCKSSDNLNYEDETLARKIPNRWSSKRGLLNPGAKQLELVPTFLISLPATSFLFRVAHILILCRLGLRNRMSSQPLPSNIPWSIDLLMIWMEIRVKAYPSNWLSLTSSNTISSFVAPSLPIIDRPALDTGIPQSALSCCQLPPRYTWNTDDPQESLPIDCALITL